MFVILRSPPRASVWGHLHGSSSIYLIINIINKKKFPIIWQMSLLLYPPRVHQFIFIFFLFFPFYFSLFVWQKSHRPSRFSPITVSFQTLLLSQNRLHSSLHPQLLSLSNCYFSPFASLLHLHPFTSFHRLLSPL